MIEAFLCAKRASYSGASAAPGPEERDIEKEQQVRDMLQILRLG